MTQKITTLSNNQPKDFMLFSEKTYLITID